jgi:uncharacterized protein (DUF1330 family)
MPKGYVIFTERVHDPVRFEKYKRLALDAGIKYGTKALVITDSPEILEGEWHGPRTVVLEFESVEVARRWYNSPEYQAVIGIRHESVESNAIIASGFEMPNGYASP